MSKLMQRWQIQQFGQQHLERVEVPVPTPGPGQILVKVAAVALNYRDKMMLENGMGGPLAWPFTPGSDLAGRVVETGAGVSRFQAGDRVISTFFNGWIDGEMPAGTTSLGGGNQPGVLAQYVLLHEDSAVAAPQSLDDLQASTLPCAGLTAWFALAEADHTGPGDTVLIQGTGGVALFGLQFAKAMGATAIVTTSSADKAMRVKALGADHVINRREQPAWGRAALELTGGRGVDHVLELAGGDISESMAGIAQGGRVSVIGVLDALEIRTSSVPLFLRHATIQGIGVGHRRAQQDMVRAIDQHGIRPVIDAEYRFDELPAALAHLERGAFGKVVVRVSD